jgi:hypothetical protein
MYPKDKDDVKCIVDGCLYKTVENMISPESIPTMLYCQAHLKERTDAGRDKR